MVTSKEQMEKNVLQMAFYPKGGLGDYLIGSKLFDLFLSYAPCHVDLYCEHPEFAQAVFGDRPGIDIHVCLNDVNHNAYWKNLRHYDFGFIIEVFVEINHILEDRIEKICPELMHVFLTHSNLYWKVRPEINNYMFCLENYISRCKLQKTDRWTTLGYKGLFPIRDHRTGVFLHESFYKRFQSLLPNGLRYITINYGADMTGLSGMQTKVWPQEYYAAFIKQFKASHPDISVVQLGGKKNAKIAGTDYYILGENLETTKWVLRRSMLHIDCEGGLVHLATQLSTRCVVMFGPTPIYFYGYPDNINLAPLKCGNCMGVSNHWSTECYRGLKQPECMYGTTPERVLEAVERGLCNHDAGTLTVAVQRVSLQKIKIIGACVALAERLGTVVTVPHNRPAAMVETALKQVPPTGRVAVVGAGIDVLPLYLAATGLKTVAFDDSFGSDLETKSTAHNRYLALCRQKGVDARFSSCMSLPYEKSHSFDFIYCAKTPLSPLELSEFKREVVRLLVPGGTLLLDEKLYRMRNKENV